MTPPPAVAWWQRIFALDLRSLALARVAAGLVLLGNLGGLIIHGGARDFLSSQGVYPRQGILDSYANLPLPSLHLANDTYAYQLALLLAHLLAALALTIGYRTRSSTAVCWILLVSLHLRNPWILNSGDVLLASALFWGIFLPWGERWSWDSRGLPALPQLHFSAASVGLVFQVASVYLFAALHKAHHPYWTTDGTAVLYALSIDAHATEWARALLAYPAPLKDLSRFVVLAELVGGLALLTPWMPLRLLTVLCCLGMHWGFGAFLEIGIFRWTPWVGLLAMLPSLVYRDSPPETLQDRLEATPRTFILLSLCAFTWAVNLQSLGQGQFRLLPPALEAVVPSLGSGQFWGVFTGDGLKEDTWNSIEVETRSGKHYDTWLGDRLFQKEKPNLLLSTVYPDDRWRKWMMNLQALFATPGWGDRFARWWLERWNLHHPEDPAVRLTVWLVIEPTAPDGSTSTLYWQRLAEVASP